MQKTTLLLFFLNCTLSAYAQFEKEIILETKEDTQEDKTFLLAADFNQDNIPEVIAREIYSYSVFMLARQADGSYGSETLIAAEGGDWSLVKTGDINGDGFLDLIIYKEEGQVLWLQNDQKGGFISLPKILFEDGEAKFLHSEDLLLMDIDQDGKDDIIVRLPSQIAWYQSIGETLSGKQTLLTIDQEKSGNFDKGQLAITDVNPDGYRTLALLTDGKIFTAHNASGTFVWDQKLTSNTLKAGYISWADMDQDSYADLVASDTYSWNGIYHLWYYPHDQVGKLAPDAQLLGQTLFSSQELRYVWSVFPADADQDGDMDLYMQVRPEGCDAESNTNLLGWLENQNSWSTTTFHQIAEEKAVAFLDLDNDQDTDIILQHVMGKQANWLENTQENGQPSFQAHQLITHGHIGGKISCAIMADIDQDNYQDIVMSVGADVVWYQGKSDHTFAEVSILRSFPGFPGDYLQAANLDQDKNLEIVIPYQGMDKFSYVAWFDKDTGDSFMSIQVERDEYPVLLGDVDQDGDLDILVAVGTEDYAWFKNEGGMFKDNLQLAQISTGTRLTQVVDLDGDGDLDVLTNEIWFENLEDGRFHKNKSVGGDMAFDIDGDGDLDIVKASASQILWYEQDEQHQFATAKVLLNKGGRFANADIDGDGDPDIITYNEEIIWWENDQGIFSQEMIIDEVEVNALALADADDDGDLDMIATGDNFAYFYRNPVNQSNPAPQDIVLSDTLIEENKPAGSVVAEISGKNAEDSLIFQLVIGEGSDDNASFEVEGNQLIAVESFDYEVKNTYYIRLQATDTVGLTFQKAFILLVVRSEGMGPVLLNPLNDQSVIVGHNYQWTIPENTFMDSDNLTYTASQDDGAALPEWLSFDPASHSFSGIPLQPDTLEIRVTVSDKENKTVSDVFFMFITEENVTGLDENQNQPVMYVFPNPVIHQQLFLHVIMPSEEVNFFLWSIDGKLIKRGKFNAYQSQQYLINLRDVKSGTYIIETKNNSYTMRKRILVE